MVEGEIPPSKETPGNRFNCPGTGQQMAWTNFGNRPISNPYPACVVCGAKELKMDNRFRAPAHPKEGD